MLVKTERCAASRGQNHTCRTHCIYTETAPAGHVCVAEACVWLNVQQPSFWQRWLHLTVKVNRCIRLLDVTTRGARVTFTYLKLTCTITIITSTAKSNAAVSYTDKCKISVSRNVTGPGASLLWGWTDTKVTHMQRINVFVCFSYTTVSNILEWRMFNCV